MPGMPMALSFNDTLGETIPSNTQHAVSVSLPTWRSNVGYEEGEKWVLDKMACGYPRFFIHKSIEKLAQSFVAAHGSPELHKAMLLPSPRCASRCKAFVEQQNPDADPSSIRALDFVPHPDKMPSLSEHPILPRISAVIYPKDLWPTAKAFWQHTGEGVQSRHAEFCQRAFDSGYLVETTSLTSPTPRLAKGPKRYQRLSSIDKGVTGPNESNEIKNDDETSIADLGVRDSAQFVEERFGRNLNSVFAAQAKLAIRRRIAGSLTVDQELPGSLDEPADVLKERTRDVPGFSTDDIFLFPCGMNAIFTAHRTLMAAQGRMKSIMYGFPYVDTLKVLQKFGPGAQFYGHGDSSDLDDLEKRLESGERFLSLFCEFPGNPLLKTPNLKRIRTLADKYKFAVVVDETIGNFLNVNILPYADVLVSSLTKVFSGDSNVMGGAMMLNPRSQYYSNLKQVLETEYEDNMFEEDSVYLERNSRDFVSRIHRVNVNAEAIASTLLESSKVKQVNYPKYGPTREFYDACRSPDGGYGGLLSATFYSVADAEAFYDNLNCAKGPSLGTNFTLSSPFVLLAHYGELDWAAQFGCEVSLVRFSVGLEDTPTLVDTFRKALAAVPGRAS